MVWKFSQVRVIEGQFVPWEPKLVRVIGSFEKSWVRENEGEIIEPEWRKSKGNKVWFEISGGSWIRGFKKSGFHCNSLPKQHNDRSQNGLDSKESEDVRQAIAFKTKCEECARHPVTFNFPCICQAAYTRSQTNYLQMYGNLKCDLMLSSIVTKPSSSSQFYLCVQSFSLGTKA